MTSPAIAVEPGPGIGRSIPIARLRRRRAPVLAGLAALTAAALMAIAAAPRPVAGQHAPATMDESTLPLAAWGPLSQALGRDNAAYRATVAASHVIVARNPRQRLTAQFSPAGASIYSGHARLVLAVRAYGYGNDLRTLRAAAPAAADNQIRYSYGQLSQWFVNGPLGIEQGFTLLSPPAAQSTGRLTIALALSGNARASLAPGGAIKFTYRGTDLSYRGLIATDAHGRTVPASFELRGRVLLLRIDDRGATYPLRIDPFVQQAKLTASHGAAGDALGSSVAIDGNTIAVGAPTSSTGPGAVYVFVKPPTGWADATETAKLTASDGVPGDALGEAFGLGTTGVGISGNTIVATAPQATVNGNSAQGAVYVFVRPPGGWHSETQAAKMTASDGTSGSYLSAVTISDKTIVAGACFAHGLQGEAYVFAEPPGGWQNATETGKLIASNIAPADCYGTAVAIQGNTILVSGNSNATGGMGGVYVFLRPAGGWRTETETAELTPGNLPAGDFPLLGTSVAIDGNTIVAGTEDFSFPGAVYVFTKPAGGWRSETQTARLTASNGSPGDLFASSVAISGRTVVAGSSGFGAPLGAVYVFDEPAAGWQTATETAQLTASDAGAADGFPFSVAIDGHAIVAGAPFATVNGNGGQGAAYVFGSTPAGSVQAGSARMRTRFRHRTQTRWASCARYVRNHRLAAQRGLWLRLRGPAACQLTATSRR